MCPGYNNKNKIWLASHKLANFLFPVNKAAELWGNGAYSVLEIAK